MGPLRAVEAFPIAVPPGAVPPGAVPPGGGDAGGGGAGPGDAGALRAAPAPRLRRQQRGLVYSEWHEALFVRLTTEDGTVGWGETLASVAPEVAAAVVRTLIAPQLLGRDPMAIEGLWADLYGAMRDRGHRTGFYIDALAGVDSALWDLRGKRAGLALYELLGGPCGPSSAAAGVPAYCGVGGGTPDAVVERATRTVQRGFKALKLHCTAGVADATAKAGAVRGALGPEVELCMDVHNTLRVDEALGLGRALERLGFRFLEAPTDPEDDAGLRALAQALDLPIAYGEGERTRWQFRDRLVAGAVDVVQPDVGYTGISELRRIAQLAEAFHVPCAPHLSAGLGVCIASAVHVSAALPNLYRLEHSPRSFALGNALLARPLALRDGAYVLPDGPGLGVEPDEAALRRYRIEER